MFFKKKDSFFQCLSRRHAVDFYNFGLYFLIFLFFSSRWTMWCQIYDEKLKKPD